MRILRKISELFKTNKSYYYPRDYYYENILNKYADLGTYLSLTNLQNKQALLTDRDIRFSDSQLFKKNDRKYLEKKYGKPNYVIVNKYSFGKITILFYRINMGGQKVKMELHFFQNSLFMYNYIFSYLKNNDKNNVLHILKEKYKINEGRNIIPNSYIMDKKKSVIVFSESINFTINYILNINSDLFRKMNDDLKGETERNKQIINRKYREIYRRL